MNPSWKNLRNRVAWLALPPETSRESTRRLFYLWLKKLTGWLRGPGKTCSRDFSLQIPKMGGRLMAGKVTLQIIILFRQVTKVNWQTLRWGDEERGGLESCFQSHLSEKKASLHKMTPCLKILAWPPNLSYAGVWTNCAFIVIRKQNLCTWNM